MAEPIIFVLDADPETRAELTGALQRRFGPEYRVLDADSPGAAQTALEQACESGDHVAVVLSDSLDWLAQIHDLCPTAARCVLVRYGDGAAYPIVRRALVMGHVDTYLLKPCPEPEERLYPVVGEILGRWVKLTRPRAALLHIVGERWAPRSHELRDLAERVSLPYQFHAHDSDEGRRLLTEVGHDGALPAVIFGRRCLVDPTLGDIARMLGARTEPEGGLYDLVVIGAGPSGLASAVYGAADGLRTLVVERHAVGGQAGTSSMIRNYVGFPRGITGAELAQRAQEQAASLGAEFIVTRGVTALESEGADRILTLDEDIDVRTRAVVIATGVSYNRLELEGANALLGKGVFYGAATAEAPAFTGRDVCVVGGGNSAGQAAIHLARYAATVTVIVRAGHLVMSDYLVKQIERTYNVDIRLDSEVLRVEGERRLESLEILNNATGATDRLWAAAMFVMIGAGPHTSWLDKIVQRDPQGHILTGRHVVTGGVGVPPWSLPRDPYPLETSLPGVFGVGDVRHNSPRGVAAAVADGAIAVRSVREYFGGD